MNADFKKMKNENLNYQIRIEDKQLLKKNDNSITQNNSFNQEILQDSEIFSNFELLKNINKNDDEEKSQKNNYKLKNSQFERTNDKEQNHYLNSKKEKNSQYISLKEESLINKQKKEYLLSLIKEEENDREQLSINKKLNSEKNSKIKSPESSNIYSKPNNPKETFSKNDDNLFRPLNKYPSIKEEEFDYYGKKSKQIKHLRSFSNCIPHYLSPHQSHGFTLSKKNEECVSRVDNRTNLFCCNHPQSTPSIQINIQNKTNIKITEDMNNNNKVIQITIDDNKKLYEEEFLYEKNFLKKSKKNDSQIKVEDIGDSIKTINNFQRFLNTKFAELEEYIIENNK